MAERGLFAFDSDPNGGPYQLVCAPTQVEELPEAVVSVATRVVFGQLRFAEMSEVPRGSLAVRQPVTMIGEELEPKLAGRDINLVRVRRHRMAARGQ